MPKHISPKTSMLAAHLRRRLHFYWTPTLCSGSSETPPTSTYTCIVLSQSLQLRWRPCPSDHDHGYYACQDHFRWCLQRKQASDTAFPAAKISTSTSAPVSQTSRRVLMLRSHAGVGAIYWPIQKPTGQDLQPQHRQHTPQTLPPYLCNMPDCDFKEKILRRHSWTWPFKQTRQLLSGCFRLYGRGEITKSGSQLSHGSIPDLGSSVCLVRFRGHRIMVRGLRWTLPSSPRAYALEGVRFSAACVWTFVLCMLGET
ncbi:hypothetical protein BKA70DRAFT_373030 [Coprinopsis sp. MPI-PUGE-AT-0042]|nr:hypothetical protein BKA70DRAFT_373030 [Coprinopsis sp. MPI-PUGE-AT-0042]